MIKALTTKLVIYCPLHYQGAFFKVISSLCFAVVNGLVRFLSGGASAGTAQVAALPFYEIAFLQNLVSSLILLPNFIKTNGQMDFNAKKYPMLYFGYAAFAVLGLLSWYGALHFLPLAVSVALGFLGPIFTIIGCRIFLKENLSLTRITAILVSILGAFFITEPYKVFMAGKEQNIHNIYLMFPMLSAIFWVGSKLCSRRLLQNGESPKATTGFLLVFMTPLSLIPALRGFMMPNLDQILLVFLIGTLSTIAHVALAKSFSLAEVSFLTPFGFVRLLGSGIIGYLAFGEIPSGTNIWAGMIIILFSLFLLASEKKI